MKKSAIITSILLVAVLFISCVSSVTRGVQVKQVPEIVVRQNIAL